MTLEARLVLHQVRRGHRGPLYGIVDALPLEAAALLLVGG